MPLKTLISAVALATAPTLMAAPAHADKAPVYTGFLSDLAVQGHDPVAYFTEGRPVKGTRDFETEYDGATWRFASQANLGAFLEDPEAYAPQYGGYCAWAVAQGDTAKGDADHWEIVDGKLYLNYNAKIQRDWAADKLAFISKADANWPQVLD